MNTKKKATKRAATTAQKPRVTHVYYQTSKEVAPYRHKHLGLSVEVPPGARPSDILAATVKLVHEQLGLPDETPRPRTVLGVERAGKIATANGDQRSFGDDIPF